MDFVKKLLEGAKGRLIRSAISLLIPLAIAHYKDNQWYIAATPLLQALSKLARDKWPGKLEWLPF